MPSTVPPRFRPLPDVAFVTDRPLRTIQTWMRRGRIDRMEDPRTGTVLVDLVAAKRLSDKAPRKAAA